MDRVAAAVARGSWSNRGRSRSRLGRFESEPGPPADATDPGQHQSHPDGGMRGRVRPVEAPTPTPTCQTCGAIQTARGRKLCATCWPVHRRNLALRRAEAGQASKAKAREQGVDSAQTPDARRKRAAELRPAEWCATGGTSPGKHRSSAMRSSQIGCCRRWKADRCANCRRRPGYLSPHARGFAPGRCPRIRDTGLPLLASPLNTRRRKADGGTQGPAERGRRRQPLLPVALCPASISSRAPKAPVTSVARRSTRAGVSRSGCDCRKSTSRSAPMYVTF
jgi:hypothetical protein